MSKSLRPLLAIAEQALAYFTDADGQAFAKLHSGGSGGCYILPLRSREYREWFYTAYAAEHIDVPSSQVFRTLLHYLEARADADDRQRRLPVFRRVGVRSRTNIPDQILIGLANSQSEVVEISATGWRTTTAKDVHIQTSRSTDPLPEPIPGDPRALDTLRSFLNVASRADWLRCLAWLLAALRPFTGTFPVLILQGPPSSGKTFAARIVRTLIDPSAALLTPIPSSVRDLHTLANQNWILAFDHVSTLSMRLSDALCRLTTSAGISLRETPSRSDEPILKTCKRPILLTVTERLSCPADLAEHALTVNFAPLPAEARRPELEFETALFPARPRILAALCDAVSTALRRLPDMTGVTGRCPDALAWALAAAPSLGCTEEEMRHAFGAGAGGSGLGVGEELSPLARTEVTSQGSGDAPANANIPPRQPSIPAIAASAAPRLPAPVPLGRRNEATSAPPSSVSSPAAVARAPAKRAPPRLSLGPTLKSSRLSLRDT